MHTKANPLKALLSSHAASTACRVRAKVSYSQNKTKRKPQPNAKLNDMA